MNYRRTSQNRPKTMVWVFTSTGATPKNLAVSVIIARLNLNFLSCMFLFVENLFSCILINLSHFLNEISNGHQHFTKDVLFDKLLSLTDQHMFVDFLSEQASSWVYFGTKNVQQDFSRKFFFFFFEILSLLDYQVACPLFGNFFELPRVTLASLMLEPIELKQCLHVLSVRILSGYNFFSTLECIMRRLRGLSSNFALQRKVLKGISSELFNDCLCPCCFCW